MTASLLAARAELLFVSDLATGSTPGRDQTDPAIREALSTHHGHVAECAADVAWRYGECQETAAERMCWCLCVITNVYERGAR